MPDREKDIEIAINDLLVKGARRLGVELMQEQVEQFLAYLQELKKWNERINLTSITEDRDIVVYHFLDSLTTVKYLKNAEAVLDIGSGGGFPGLPIKIALSEVSVVLLDSIGKKTTFIRHVVRKLGLKGVSVVQGRAEDPEVLKKVTGALTGTKGGFDVVISRALTDLSAYVEIARPYVKESGIIIAMKGPREKRLDKELQEIKNGTPCELHEVSIPFTDKKTSLVIFSN